VGDGARWSIEGAMDRALDAATAAAVAGEVPVGAVVLHQGRLVAVAANRREADQDPTAHAEVLALREAAATLGRWRLDDVTLVVTLEPCTMCAGAIVAARVPRVVIGTMDERAGAAGSRYNILDDPRLNHRAEVTLGVGATRSAELLSEFFRARRG
jgi:tRNA(adenine34) deaminase